VTHARQRQPLSPPVADRLPTRADSEVAGRPAEELLELARQHRAAAAAITAAAGGTRMQASQARAVQQHHRHADDLAAAAATAGMSHREADRLLHDPHALPAGIAPGSAEAARRYDSAVRRLSEGTLMPGTDLIARLRDQRDDIDARMRGITQAAIGRGEELSPTEREQFTQLHAERQAVADRVAELAGTERSDAAAASLRRELGQTGARAVGVGGGSPYDPSSAHGPSYFRDLARVATTADPAAAERLHRASAHTRSSLHARALSATDGAGGDFVPPLWLVEQFVELSRPGRVFVDRFTRGELPAGTDTITVPKFATGTAVAQQVTQNTLIQNTDATTAAVSAPVITLAGGQTVSLQLIEQSPLNMDEVILRDLLADYAAKLDAAAISGAGGAGVPLGALNVTGLNAVTYTDASPTVAKLYTRLADAIQQIATGRMLPPTSIVMHPRRWAWVASGVDTAGRPLVVPTGGGAVNAVGTGSPALDPAGPVGQLLGLPVYVDPNIPTTLGTGTNEDRIVIMRGEDLHLWEGIPRAEAFRDTKADQLGVFLRVYNYVALQPARYPKAISVVSGTGLATPTFD